LAIGKTRDCVTWIVNFRVEILQISVSGGELCDNPRFPDAKDPFLFHRPDLAPVQDHVKGFVNLGESWGCTQAYVVLVSKIGDLPLKSPDAGTLLMAYSYLDQSSVVKLVTPQALFPHGQHGALDAENGVKHKGAHRL
jgi:hypothetical protein